MRSFGWEIDLVITRRPGHATELAREAAAAGAAVVFACGGDGTLNEVVNGLAGGEAAVGVLRGGMGNVFAKEIGVPKSPEMALRCLVDGERRRFDLGVVHLTPSGEPAALLGDPISAPDANPRGKHFLVMGGVGLDGDVVKGVPTGAKRWLGSASYVLWGIRELLRYRPRQTCLAVDGTRCELDLYWLLVGNTRSYGGVLDIARNAVVDDGALDVYIFEGRRVTWLAQTAVRLVAKRQDGAPGITFHRIEQLDVLTEGLSVQVDGEFIGKTPASFTVASGAIDVLLPRGKGRQLFSKQA
jgi:YegS/Rv2252/BmrU family lipid kinase